MNIDALLATKFCSIGWLKEVLRYEYFGSTYQRLFALSVSMTHSTESTPEPRPRKRDKIKHWVQKVIVRSHDASPSLSQDTNSRGPSRSEKFKDGAGVVWSGIETSLKVLKQCSDWNPILKSAVGGIVACIELVGVRAFQSRRDTDQLRSLY